jgi:hypothetical protein
MHQKQLKRNKYLNEGYRTLNVFQRKRLLDDLMDDLGYNIESTNHKSLGQREPHQITEKEIINKVQRQAIEWEKIFPIHESNKGLIFQIYKKVPQLIEN